MICNDLENYLAEYVDGSLPAVMAAAMGLHLAECPKCRAEIEVARFARQSLAGLPSVEAPLNLEQRILNATSRKPRLMHYLSGLFGQVPVPAFALVLLAIVAGVVVMRMPFLKSGFSSSNREAAEVANSPAGFNRATRGESDFQKTQASSRASADLDLLDHSGNHFVSQASTAGARENTFNDPTPYVVDDVQSKKGGEYTAGPVQIVLRIEGVNSGWVRQQQFAILNPPALKTLWERIWSTRMDPPPLPQVDFTRQVLLAVSLGSQPTSGHSINIASVTRDGSLLHVKVATQRPVFGSAQTASMTQPYSIVVLDLGGPIPPDLKVDFSD